MSPLFEALLTAWPRLLLVAAVAFVVAEAWRRLALRRGVLDVPGHRSSHAVATPRGAGIGIAVASALAIALWAPQGTERSAVLVGGLVVGLVGLVDDLRTLPASWKFAGQALAALPVAIALPLAPDGLPIVLPPVLATAASVAMVLLFVNAWNFMDGIDGIAAWAAVAVCASVLVVAGVGGAALVATIAMALLAACLGFLPLNFPKARAFMGDCGSHVLGLGLAVLVLAAPRVEGAAVAMAASAAFLVDVLGTLALRARDGEPLASAHRRHLYQLVTRSGYSHARVTMAYAAWMLASGGGMVMAQQAGLDAIGAGLILFATVSAWWWLQRHFSSHLKERGQW
ncbi:lipopolysaccharide biosynthesis protein [Silanimonas sp.]|uniref:lipopolysaccharide biosynthesis protein n=1 Tax=Silanimonas sp. TaxID=1929290 RepID=UPI0022BB0741|nr:lipopolysaccharide biosynthesis protein [Silanimonas sp.]MCZ8113575.1 lipopolysaccharide biosynthesis protein [Silanimonas sp.]